MKNTTICLLTLLLVATGTAHAAVQMLPPVQSGSSTVTCATGEGSKVLTWDGANPITCQQSIVTAPNGNVGIGTASPATKLDVAGGIKIGSDATLCNATNIGLLKVHSTQLFFCNGTQWREVSTGPQFGGMYQTHLCDASGVFRYPSVSGGCRLANAVTGSCSCPAGFTAQRTTDFNSPLNVCPQEYYEGRGMIQWVCVKP